MSTKVFWHYNVYHQLFYFMEDEGILDPLDNLHLIALHHVYLENIQEKLEIWSRAWSQLRIRTTKSLPIRMWIAGQLQNPVGIELGHNEIDCYGTEGFINYDDDVEDGSGRPIFDSLCTEGFINYDDDVEDGSGRPIFDSF